MLESLPAESEVLDRLVAWAQTQPAVRAMLLTSSRARPEPGVDALSDYDVILAVAEPERFVQEEVWKSIYGPPLLSWGDQGSEVGMTTYFRGVVYADFVKIDFTFWPLALLEQITARGVLPLELDAGYRVLLDKDARTAAWPAASYRAFRPTPPTAADYQALVEEFWWGVSYVAKSFWRDDLLFARWCLDNDLKLVTMRRLLEWRVAMEHGWSLRPGVLGRGLKQRLPADLWNALAATYTSLEPEANWQALYGTVDVFRRVALEVGQAFGFAYPEALEAQMRLLIKELRGRKPLESF